MLRKCIWEVEFEDVNLIELMVGFSINAAGCLTTVTRDFNKLVFDQVFDQYSIGCVLHVYAVQLAELVLHLLILISVPWGIQSLLLSYDKDHDT
jgi:hypothetical protein